MNRHAVILFVALLLGIAPVFGQSEVIDGIAAVVNKDVITYSQLREMIGSSERALRDAYRGEELTQKIKEARLGALKELIDRQLILQEFKKMELSIPEYAVEDSIRQRVILPEFGGDRSAYVRTLRAQGYSVAEFKEITRDQIILREMKRIHMKKDFVVSPAQVQAYYDSHKEEYTTPEQVKLRMIVLREDDDSGLPGGKKEMAEEIRSKLVSGAEFGRMAQMYSEDPSTQEVEGDWGWIDRRTLSKPLTETAFGLRAGEISDVVSVGNSFYILMVEARKNASTKSISEVRDEIEQNLIQQEEKAEYERWLDTLREKAYIKIYS